jgi:hypothetical protein
MHQVGKKSTMPDIDLDLADRTKILSKIKHINAAIINDDKISQHNTGIYCQDIPYNAITNTANLDYKVAESRGYFKLDFLNLNLYQQVKDEQHLNSLLSKEPNWHKLYDKEFCSRLIHIGNHYDTLIAMPEAVTNINKMAMFLAVIRPAKRHLIGKSWDEVAKTIWIKPSDNSYYFKHSHSVGYAHLVVVNMNLLEESVHSSN